ncbi:hypothetical protein OIU76_006394 [Salix suchowensis]|nr:hypothetical protein OIU76_006394 [Salix suchowensis]
MTINTLFFRQNHGINIWWHVQEEECVFGLVPLSAPHVSKKIKAFSKKLLRWTLGFLVWRVSWVLKTSSEAPSRVSPPETKQKILGSVSSKQERSASSAQDDYWRTSKMPKNNDFSVTKTMSLHQPASLLRSNYMFSDDSRQQEHMMSFSSPRPETTPFLRRDGGFVERSTQNHTASSFPYYQNTASSYIRSAGYDTGALNAGMHGDFYWG